jgi:hypothetical protein
MEHYYDLRGKSSKTASHVMGHIFHSKLLKHLLKPEASPTTQCPEIERQQELVPLDAPAVLQPEHRLTIPMVPLEAFFYVPFC